MEGLKHQQSLHKFTQPSSHLQNGDAVEWMRSILVLQLKRLDGESVNKIRGLQELLLNGGSVFDPMKEIMADESKVVGNELTARNINSATAGKDGFNWVRVVKRHQDNYLVLLKFQSTKSREAAFNSLKAFSGDLTYFGPSDKEISSFSASQPPSACIKQVLEGKLPMDAVWKSEKFCGLIRLYFEVLKTGGDCYDSLLNNQRYGLDGRLQALAYLTLLLDDN